MSRTVKHPNACMVPGCQLCHYGKKARVRRLMRLPFSDRRRGFYEPDESPEVVRAAFDSGEKFPTRRHP